MLLCADAAGVAAALAGGQPACPCGLGRLARWGHARQRVIALPGGVRAPAAACPGALPGLRPDPGAAAGLVRGIAVIATAACAALEGAGHRVIAARLGVAAGTVRGWLRRLRARAEPLRCLATRQLAAFDPHAWLLPAGSPLGDALAALAAAVHAAGPASATARTSPGPSSVRSAWATRSCPPLADDHLCRSRASPCPHRGPGPAAILPVTATAAAVTDPATA